MTDKNPESSGDDIVFEEGKRFSSLPSEGVQPKEMPSRSTSSTPRPARLEDFFRGADSWCPGLPDLDWHDPIAALNTLQRHLVLQTQGTIEYYLRQKKKAKNWTYFFRGLAILLGTAATLTPAFIGLYSQVEDIARWAPLSTIFAALAAGMLGIDRFFGFSSGWMRFVWAAIDLEGRLDEFEMEWAAIEFKLSREKMDDDAILTHLQWMKAFRRSVDAQVKRETAQWIKDFRGRVQEADRAASMPTAASGVLSNTSLKPSSKDA